MSPPKTAKRYPPKFCIQRIGDKETFCSYKYVYVRKKFYDKKDIDISEPRGLGKKVQVWSPWTMMDQDKKRYWQTCKEYD